MTSRSTRFSPVQRILCCWLVPNDFNDWDTCGCI